MDPDSATIEIVHRGSDGLRFTYEGPCRTNGRAVRRSLADLSEGNDDRLIAHRLPCTLLERRAYTAFVNATDNGGKRYRGELGFSTGSRNTVPGLDVLGHVRTPRDEVDDLFERYVFESLLEEIDSPLLAALAAVAIAEIAEVFWEELTASRAVHPVIAQRVAYRSRSPSGELSTLTGLVAMPAIGASANFQRGDRVIILGHGTGSTPSSLDFADAWHVLANLIAARGYLVIAADNWGRGGTSGDAPDGTPRPETYLMVGPTANATLDLVAAVLSHDDYADFHDPAIDADVTVMGYSQGGHSAVAVWLAAQVGGSGLKIRELYSGGAPHSFYRTVRGALEELNGTCAEDVWCRDVDRETVMPYLTNRILEPLLAYADVGLAREEIIDGDEVTDELVSGVLGTDPRYDRLRIVLQLNSFTNILQPTEATSTRDTAIHLYHSTFDRLVPHQNTLDLAELLSPELDVVFHSDECSDHRYEALAATIPIVGVVHSVCGIHVINRFLEDLHAGDEGIAGPTVAESVAERTNSLRAVAEHHAKAALDSPDLAEFRARTSTETRARLSEMLRDTGSEVLARLAGQLDKQ